MSAWIAAFWEKPIPVFEFLKTLCLIVPFDSDLINPPIWTLSVEITILFFLPFIKRCIQKYSSFMVWIMCVLLTAIGPLKYLPTFVLGMCIRKEFESVSIKECAVVKRLAFVSISVVLLDFPYLMTSLDLSVPDVIGYNAVAIGAGLLIVIFRDLQGGLLKILAGLGDNSYSFYLIHFIVLLWFRFLLSDMGFLIYGLVSFGVSILAALLGTRIECACRRLLRRT